MDYLKKIIKRNKKSFIKIEELFYLNELLQSDLPLKACLNLITNKQNEKLISDLLVKLEKGSLIEEIIDDYLPKEISAYMKNLLVSLSFKESLTLALSFYNKNKENAVALRKAISYPIVLLFISLTALYLFDSYGLDSILNLMKSFNASTGGFIFLRIILKILVYFFYFSFIVISIIFLIFINDKRITLFYIILSKYLPNSIIKIYFTEDFVSLLVITLNLGYKSKEALEILKRLKNKPVISFLAFHLDDGLLEGKSLTEASKKTYFDETLEKFMNIASYTTNFTGILENYVELANSKIVNSMKRLTTILQLISYAIVGFVIVFIYQVLFLPMQAIISF